MSKLNQVTAAITRALAWLLPARRRDWVAAIWAEAHHVPPGLARLAWRAGGVWVTAREVLMPRGPATRRCSPRPPESRPGRPGRSLGSATRRKASST